jgi:type III pantothenate kinase
MILVCDIGNSFIKSAIFNNETPTNYNVNKDFSSVLKFIKSKEIRTVVISAVVPSKLKLLLKELSSFSSIKSFVIHKDLKFNLSIKYSTPNTLGMDRICSAEGAFYLVQTSGDSKSFKKGDYILSIDCGTATTINIIQYPNIFVGGLIAPGLDMMFSALHTHTAQLPKLAANNYKTLIGNSTKTSIASGVINSTVGMINQAIVSLAKKPKNLFITGGNAKYIIPYLKYDIIYDKALVLYGIKAIYNRNEKII